METGRLLAEEQVNQYLNHLFSAAIDGNLDAGDELSKIALGGHPEAQELVKKMDCTGSSQNSPKNP